MNPYGYRARKEHSITAHARTIRRFLFYLGSQIPRRRPSRRSHKWDSLGRVMMEKLGRAIQASYNEPGNLLKPKEKCYEYPDIRIGSSGTDIAYEPLKSASLA
jgi:hypothetical protein